MATFLFKVVAKETSTSEELQAVASVTVNVTDLNDNNPKCSQAVYRETVLENLPGNTFVVQVRKLRAQHSSLASLYSLLSDRYYSSDFQNNNVWKVLQTNTSSHYLKNYDLDRKADKGDRD